MTTAFLKSTGQTPVSRDGDLLTEAQISSTVQDVLATTQFIDIHTHLFAPAFGKLGLWGIDELLTYHYLEAEFFRSSDTKPEAYWSLSKRDQADAIWRTLFVENTPVSEATRGVVAVLKAFHLPTDRPDLVEARSFFKAQTIEAHIRKVLQLAGVSTVVMTNDPLDPEEAAVWLKGVARHRQFRAVLRLDRILCNWPAHWQVLAGQGYRVDEQASGKSPAEVRRFLADWYKRMQPVYMAVSLPDQSIAEGNGAACLPRIESAALAHDWSAQAGQSIAAFGGRRRGQSGPAGAGESVPRVSNQSLSGQHPQPGEPARTLRVRAEVQQLDAVRLLVVHEQSFDCGGDHSRTHRDAGNKFYSAAFRCPRARASHLQMEQHAQNPGAHPF